MNKKFLLTLTIFTFGILLAGNLVVENIAFAEKADDKNNNKNDKNQQTLAQMCSKLDDKDSFKTLVCQTIISLQNQLTNLSFTQTDPSKPALQLQTTTGATAPPLVVSNQNNDNLFTVFPNSTVKVGAHSIVINPLAQTITGFVVQPNQLVSKGIYDINILGNAATATNANHATHADTADTATNANHATTADTATTATNAGHATTADDATHATTSDTATNAGHATTADTATTATNAGHATTADSATTASTLTKSDCGDRQVIKWDKASGIWVCADDDTGSSAGGVFDNLSVSGSLHTNFVNQIQTMYGDPVSPLNNALSLTQNNAYVVFIQTPQVILPFTGSIACIDDKPDGTVIMLNFPNGGLLQSGSCPGKNGIQIPTGTDPITPGDTVALIDTGNTWKEVAKGLAKGIVELPRGTPGAQDTISGNGMRLGTSYTSLVVFSGPYNPSLSQIPQLNCIEDKPDGTTIVLTFANNGRIDNSISCQPGTAHIAINTNQINPSNPTDRTLFNPGNMLVLMKFSGNWIEVTRS